MIRLRALQLATSAWKTTLEISGKLRPGAWVLIAVLHGSIAATVYVGTHQETRQAIRSYYTRSFSITVKPGQSTYVVHMSDPSGSASPSPYLHRISGVTPQTTVAASFTLTIVGSNFNHGHIALVLPQTDDSDPFRWRPRERVPFPAVVVETPEAVITPIERQIALLVQIFEAIMMLLAAFFAWQQYRLRKSQEILMALQMREIQVRLDQLEKARQRQAEKSRIIIP